MTTQELHIAIDILLQKSSSNWNKNFLPQELDFFLNREITKFIKTRFNPRSNTKQLGSFDTIKRVQDTNVLYNTVSLPILSLNQKEVYIKLPFDFLDYISSEIDLIPNCNPSLVPDSQISYNYKTVTIPNFISASTLIISTVINGLTTVLFDLTSLPNEYFPQDSIQDYRKEFIYSNAIIGEITRKLPKDLEFRYNKLTKKLEFRSTKLFLINVIRNGVVITTTDTIEVDLYKLITTTLTSPVRIVDEEFKSDINNSYLSKSKDENVVAYLRDDGIIFPKVKNVVMKTVNLTYKVKPLKIDLLLGYNSELPDTVLEEIVGNVAESIKAVIASDTYEKFKQDNLLTE
jgi:hypothetical protein